MRLQPYCKSRRRVCENKYYEVFFDDLEDPNGNLTEDYLVLAPKRKSSCLVTGVAVLPVVKDLYAVLKIYRHAIQDYSWEVPRGFVEDGEENLQSVRRELFEETGLDCPVNLISSLGYITPEAGTLAARIHLFFAPACEAKAAYHIQEMGHQELRLFTDVEMSDMIENSLIQDVSTIAAYHRALKLKKPFV